MVADNQTDNVLRACRIIMAAMIAGVVIFTVVIAGVTSSQHAQGRSDLSPVMFPVLIVFAASGILASFVIHPILLKQARRAAQALQDDTDSNHVVGVALKYWQTYTIISAGVAESIGFFAGIVYMVTGSQPVLLMVGLSLLLLILRFPARRSVDGFISHAISP